MKKLMVLLFALVTTAAYAQNGVDSFVELLRSDAKTDKKAIIAAAMEYQVHQVIDMQISSEMPLVQKPATALK